MPVRAIYYGTGRRNRLFLKIGIDIPLIKPIVSENRYRQTFHNSIVCVSDDRYRQTFHHHSIVSDDRYRYVDLSPFYCFCVGEQRRSKTAGLGTINSSSPFIIHAARPSSPAENPRRRRCLSLISPKKLKVDGLNNKVITNYVCSMRSSSLQCFRATCLCAVQFLLIPWIIPYRIGYWANNRSAIMRIDTYRGAQQVGFGVYRQVL